MGNLFTPADLEAEKLAQARVLTWAKLGTPWDQLIEAERAWIEEAYTEEVLARLREEGHDFRTPRDVYELWVREVGVG